MEAIQHASTSQKASSVPPKTFYGSKQPRTYLRSAAMTRRNADATSEGDELDFLGNERSHLEDGPKEEVVQRQVRRRPQPEPIEIDLTEYDLAPRR